MRAVRPSEERYFSEPTPSPEKPAEPEYAVAGMPGEEASSELHAALPISAYDDSDIAAAAAPAETPHLSRGRAAKQPGKRKKKRPAASLPDEEPSPFEMTLSD